MRPGRRRAQGFTLLEVLAVLFLTALVIGAALDSYVNLSNQSAHASEVTREMRRATGLLDRVARELERTLLVEKPPETDPLAHPWLFVAESRLASGGADRVKFVARQPAAGSRQQAPELAMVAFMLREAEDGEAYELLRWSRPGLPEGLDRDFPLPDDPGTLVLARGLHHFALRFLDENGEWLPEWDSSQLIDSSTLPLAVEVEVAMEPLDELLPEEARAHLYRRRVALPVRPLDLVALFDPEGGADGAGEEGDCDESLLVRDCIDEQTISDLTGGAVRNLDEAQAIAGQGLAGTQSLTGGNVDIDAILDSPWCSVRDVYGGHPAVKAECR
jgi:prepilin-type N-terminal cleavage/methylation domain-containing protein